MNDSLIKTIPLQAAEPLWQRVPTRTEYGELTADFMMLIKRLKLFHQQKQQLIFNQLNHILNAYASVILFAEVNVQLGTLWVTHRPRPGLGLEIAALIHTCIPEARLIGQHCK
ncbi:MAG: hypothetical protein GC149_03690 [Gammaproteobacteria bacterium]|nr:hypothetical protein [Gammaproteobacteria bacterium]